MARCCRNTITYLLLLLFVFSLAGGCVYYNTFFNARQAFNSAEKARKESKYGQAQIRTGDYKTAIEKSLKVVENYPNSKWYDDAVYVLAVSYFYTKQYRKSERRCRELLANFPDSKYALDAKLYLSKTKLEQNEIDVAMDLFGELFHSDVERSLKTEAAMALGTFHFDNKRYTEAQQYFLAVRDSLGSEEQKKVAQNCIADGYFQVFQFKDALGAYLQILGMNPDNNERYHALYQAALCSYRVQQINTGLDYLQTLIKDEAYFDSLGVLKIKLAEGYEYKDDLDQAEAIYQEVATEGKNRKVAAEAYYILALIYQFDHDDLKKAKEYYDKVVELNRSSENGQDALQRSSDIGKLETFARTLEIDSTTTQEAIDNAAYTQYQLAELYWSKLNKPDTAILEMQYLVDSFPTAYDTPKGMISLSQMVREHEKDTAKADSILRAVLEEYPQSDFVSEALELLGLLGTAADTGYAGVYIKKAEDFLIDEENVDSARAYYTYVVDHFPDSEYYLQARFALIWLTEMYESPGDSSVIFAYSEFVDSFPGSFWASEAKKRTSYHPPPKIATEEMVDSTMEQETESPLASEGEVIGEEEDTAAYIDPLEALYTAPDGERAIDLPSYVKPIEVRDEFEYPTEAYAAAWEGDLNFHIKLDFTGEVIDYVLKTYSGIDEIDRRAEEAVASTIFDVSQVRPEEQGVWFLYKFKVALPGHLK
jgi:tetratricopeptide (TPR) repeat protein